MNIIHIEKPGAIQTDIHKGGLHAGEDPDNPPTVDIAHQPLLPGLLQIKLHQIAVFHQSNPDLVGCGIDQQFGRHESPQTCKLKKF